MHPRGSGCGVRRAVTLHVQTRSDVDLGGVRPVQSTADGRLRELQVDIPVSAARDRLRRGRLVLAIAVVYAISH
eukprot:COSAG04_NODE_22480_length_354_cov_0.807843_1_plen_73_part_10